MISASTLYLTSWGSTTGGDPPFWYPTTYQGGWDTNPPGNKDSAMLSYQGGNDISTGTASESVTSTFRSGLFRYASSDTLTAQTISGTLALTLGASEAASSAIASIKLYLYVSAGETDTVRGVLLDLEDASVLPTTAAGVHVVSALSAVAVQSGDHLVAELGVIFRNSTGTAQSATLYAGVRLGATALSASDTNVTTHNPTLVFSTPLTFDVNPLQSGDVIQGNEQLIINSSADGSTVRVVAVPGNDFGPYDPANGAFLADGTLVLPLNFTNQILLLDRTLTPLLSFDAVGSRPQSVAIDKSDHIFVGFRGNNGGTSDSYAVRKFDRGGTLLQTFNVTTDGTPQARSGGSCGIDLASDQRTLYYVGGGRKVMRWDVESDAALTDFVTLPSDGGAARGLKLLPLNEVFVVDTIDGKRLDVNGQIIARFDVTGQDEWLTAGISPDASQVWMGSQTDTPPAMIAKFTLNGSLVFTVTGDDVPETDSLQGTTPVGQFQAATSQLVIYPNFVTTDVPIRRVRRSPHVFESNKRIFLSRLEPYLRAGIGTPSGQGIAADVMLRVSKDGGQTWGAERVLSAGALGRYATRLQAYQFGVARDWVFEVSVSDPNVPWVLMDLFADIEEGTS